MCLRPVPGWNHDIFRPPDPGGVAWSDATLLKKPPVSIKQQDPTVRSVAGPNDRAVGHQKPSAKKSLIWLDLKNQTRREMRLNGGLRRFNGKKNNIIQRDGHSWDQRLEH